MAFDKKWSDKAIHSKEIRPGDTITIEGIYKTIPIHKRIINFILRRKVKKELMVFKAGHTFNSKGEIK